MPFLAEGGATAEEVEAIHQAWVKVVLLQVILWSYPYVREGDFLGFRLRRLGLVGVWRVVLQRVTCGVPALIDSVLGALQRFRVGVINGLGVRVSGFDVWSRVHGHGYTPSDRGCYSHLHLECQADDPFSRCARRKSC